MCLHCLSSLLAIRRRIQSWQVFFRIVLEWRAFYCHPVFGNAMNQAFVEVKTWLNWSHFLKIQFSVLTLIGTCQDFQMMWAIFVCKCISALWRQFFLALSFHLSCFLSRISCFKMICNWMNKILVWCNVYIQAKCNCLKPYSLSTKLSQRELPFSEFTEWIQKCFHITFVKTMFLFLLKDFGCVC